MINSIVNEEQRTIHSLKEAMEILEVTPEQLAEMADVSITSVIRATEGSDHRTNEEIAYRIADALGMRMDELTWRNGLTQLGRKGINVWTDETKEHARVVRVRVSSEYSIRQTTEIIRHCQNPACNAELPLASDECSLC